MSPTMWLTGLNASIPACLSILSLRWRSSTRPGPQRRRTAQGAADPTGLDIAMAARLAALSAEPSQHRVSRLAQWLACRAGFAQGEAEQLRAAAMLHRIGRIALPDGALQGGASPDRAEQASPEIGARLLAGTRQPVLDRAAELALGHCERWDGTGYPRRLSGCSIPIGARIVALATGLDALLEARPPLSLPELARRLDDASGRAFDPGLVRAVLAELPALVALRRQDEAAGSPERRRQRSSRPGSVLHPG